MKTAILLCLCTTLFISLSCTDTGTIPAPSVQQETLGNMLLRFAEAPAGITTVTAKLSRSGYTDRTINLSISDSSASGSFNEVPVGMWHLRIEARDSTNAVRYSGETDVNVNPGQTAQVSLQLLPTSGSIVITVTWGTPSQNSDTIALWHLNEASGQNILDSSPYHNNGQAFGTTVVPGQLGNARRFNGSGNYISVPNNNSFNFGLQSFTIDTWFRTTQTDSGEFVRYGLAPNPGYLLRINGGRVLGVIGDRGDAQPPSMILRITSTASYNNGNWHHAVFIRDRSQGKLFLYVDGVQATQPVNDIFTLPITNTEPLMIGRWISNVIPTYFNGDLDEVIILRGAHHPGS